MREDTIHRTYSAPEDIRILIFSSGNLKKKVYLIYLVASVRIVSKCVFKIDNVRV
jgi:hypothetical protein